jgi:hypothetical protein
LSLLLSFLSPVHGADTNLVELANNYNYELFWGKELGEAPLLYSIDSLSDYDNQVSVLQDNLNKLNEIDPSFKSTQLWLDLKNYTQQELFVKRSCQPGVWDYAEAYQLMFFFNKINFTLQDAGTIVNDASWVSKAMNIFVTLLETYSEKIDISRERGLVPSRSSFIFSFESPDDIGMNLEYFIDFLDNYKAEFCANCNDFNRDQYIENFKLKIQPKIDSFFNSIADLKKHSLNNFYLVPEAVKNDCFTAVVSTFGSSQFTPLEMLMLGEKELQRAEDKMYNLIIENDDTVINSEKTEIINRYLIDLLKSDSQSYSSSQDYLSKINRIIERAYVILPQVTNHYVSFPNIRDLNYETDQFVMFYKAESATIMVNSQAYEGNFSLASSIIHEGVPGHHLERQLSKKKTMSNSFEQNFFSNDYVEGWAFYMEEFVDQVNFYESLEERLGYLEEIRIRALRLILPYKFFFENWTESQARKFSLKHSVMGEIRLNSEIGRNSQWRGQVLSYMLGKDAILKMREKAHNKLGPQFSVIKFHDFIISHGDINLKSLNLILDQWINQQLISE